MTKTNLEDDWEKDWKEFYGLYGDIGRSEEDIKDFIRKLIVQERKNSREEFLEDLKIILSRTGKEPSRKEKDREEILEKLSNLLGRYLSAGRVAKVLEELKND